MTVSSGPEKIWREALAEGRFLLQRSGGIHIFPPRVMAPGTDDLAWVEASGTGVVYAVTVIYPKPPADPYTVALIDLAEGPRIMSRVDGIAAADVKIGLPVKARIADALDGPLLVFDPA